MQELLPGWEELAAAQAAQGEQQQQQGQPPPQQRQPQWRGGPALLVTGGGLALPGDAPAAQAVEWGVEGIAVAKAAQHKLVALLAASLAPRGVFVGQATVRGVVRGTAWDDVRSSADEEQQPAGAGGGGAQQQGAGGGGGGSGGEGEGSTIPYVTPDEVADALMGLLEARPAGGGWHVFVGDDGDA